MGTDHLDTTSAQGLRGGLPPLVVLTIGLGVVVDVLLLVLTGLPIVGIATTTDDMLIPVLAIRSGCAAAATVLLTRVLLGLCRGSVESATRFRQVWRPFVVLIPIFAIPVAPGSDHADVLWQAYSLSVVATAILLAGLGRLLTASTSRRRDA